MSPDASDSSVGSSLELELGAPAHGGSCVARADDGRVVFVRHALPGELVRAAVTEDKGGSYLRADAVEILRPHAARVTPPCPHAGPGRCGGCDWQHASGSLQRELKAESCANSSAGSPASTSAACCTASKSCRAAWSAGAPASPTRATRRATRVAQTPVLGRASRRPLPARRRGRGRRGRAERDVARRPRSVTGVEVVRGVDGVVTVLEHRPGPGRHARGRRPPDRSDRRLDGPAG